jgi:hypothetical protein
MQEALHCNKRIGYGHFLMAYFVCLREIVLTVETSKPGLDLQGVGNGANLQAFSQNMSV